MKAGLFGPRLTALVALMKGVCHASFSTSRQFLRDVVWVEVSRGYLAKLIGKVSESLAPSYAELFQRLPGEAVLNIDETGHKENGLKFWTWCFRAPMCMLFHIDKSRGSKVLVEVLGEEFDGVLGCDYFNAHHSPQAWGLLSGLDSVGQRGAAGGQYRADSSGLAATSQANR